MRKTLALAALVAAGAFAAPAAMADERRCYSPNFSGIPIVEDWPTTEQCIFLPIEPELR